MAQASFCRYAGDMMRVFFCCLMICLSLCGSARAAVNHNAKLEACLKKASDLPDMGEAYASAWIKQGGGEQARFCHAAAQFNRDEFAASAKEFAALAALHDKNDPSHAADLHARAGLTYMRADDISRAESEYAAALRLEPDDPEMWIDRATERGVAEKYWDAISDLNHALAIMPDNTDALRLRAQAWSKLGNEKNAAADFLAAEQIDEDEAAKPASTGK
jgi:tetratricopeptide (TPR) repeat protein